MWNSLEAYGQAFSFLRKNNLSWFLLFPLVITVLVVTGGFSLVSMATESISAWLETALDASSWLPEWASFIQDILYWLLWIVLRILLYFAFAFFGGTVILILMAPILTWLSERVAVKLKKSVPEFTAAQFIRDLSRAIGLALKNGVIQFGLTVACFIIGFIPIIGVASPFFLFGINAYFFGYNFMDYTLERKQLSIRESNAYVWQHRWNTIGLGIPFALWMLIPFLGPMTAGFMAVFATVASTLNLEKKADFPSQEPIKH